MTKQPVCGNEPSYPTFSDCRHAAVVLHGIILGIDLLENEGRDFDEARSAITMAALAHSKKLAEDLDRVRP